MPLSNIAFEAKPFQRDHICCLFTHVTCLLRKDDDIFLIIPNKD